jgi:hypothetical protein
MAAYRASDPSSETQWLKLAAGQVDLLCPQEPPETLLMDVDQFARQQRCRPVCLSRRRRLVETHSTPSRSCTRLPADLPRRRSVHRPQHDPRPLAHPHLALARRLIASRVAHSSAVNAIGVASGIPLIPTLNHDSRLWVLDANLFARTLRPNFESL